MACFCFAKCGVTRFVAGLQLMLGGLVIIVSLTSLFRFYSAGFFMHHEDICHRFYGIKDDAYDGFDVRALSDRVSEVLEKMEELQSKLESEVQVLEKDKGELGEGHITKEEFKRYLEEEMIRPLYGAHISLRQIRLPRSEGIRNTTEPPLINYFVNEELRKYITPKENRHKRINIYKTAAIHNTIGHACVLMKKDLEEYMSYEIASYCRDDWKLALKLMLNGCDPLPRRRCLSRNAKTYEKPYPINESLWKIPDDRNVRWGNYRCDNFKCLSSNNTGRGFIKCIGCFEMEKEKLKWVVNNNNTNNSSVDFIIIDILAIKAGGEIRIGLDYSIGTGTFAARMREQNVTMITTALNLGAPFNEMIALRGLLPLHITPSQRLPFFDNTMDLIHTTGFLDGWMDLLLLDFILFDWDRILRPGGLLWIDKFFCNRQDLEDYMYMFLQFRYKKHKWVVAPKSGDQVYLSAVLEKPRRSV